MFLTITHKDGSWKLTFCVCVCVCAHACMYVCVSEWVSSLTPDVTQSPLRFTQGLNVLDELAGEERVCMFTEAKHCINHTHYKQGLPNHTFSLAKQARTKQDRSNWSVKLGSGTQSCYVYHITSPFALWPLTQCTTCFLVPQSTCSKHCGLTNNQVHPFYQSLFFRLSNQELTVLNYPHT